MQLESHQDGAVGLGQRVHTCSQTQMTGVAVHNVDELDGCGQRQQQSPSTSPPSGKTQLPPHCCASGGRSGGRGVGRSAAVRRCHVRRGVRRRVRRGVRHRVRRADLVRRSMRLGRHTHPRVGERFLHASLSCTRPLRRHQCRMNETSCAWRSTLESRTFGNEQRNPHQLPARGIEIRWVKVEVTLLREGALIYI